MSVQVNAQLICTVNEQGSVVDAPSGFNTVIHRTFNSALALNANSSPPASQVAAFTQALVGGVSTIDLTNLIGTFGTVNGTGLRVQVIKIKNSSTSNTMTFKFGGSNPYNLLGASWQIILPAGGEAEFFLNNGAPVVGSGAKNIDMSGTGTDSAQIIIVLG